MDHKRRDPLNLSLMRILCLYHFSGRGESSSVMFFSSFHAMAMYLSALASALPVTAEPIRMRKIKVTHLV
jgi:hypothetical protein